MNAKQNIQLCFFFKFPIFLKFLKKHVLHFMILKYMSVYVSRCVNTHYTCMHAYMFKKQTNKQERIAQNKGQQTVVRRPDQACCLFFSIPCCWHMATFIHFFVVLACFRVSMPQSRSCDRHCMAFHVFIYDPNVYYLPLYKKNLLTSVIKEHVHLSSTKSNIKKRISGLLQSFQILTQQLNVSESEIPALNS